DRGDADRGAADVDQIDVETVLFIEARVLGDGPDLIERVRRAVLDFDFVLCPRRRRQYKTRREQARKQNSPDSTAIFHLCPPAFFGAASAPLQSDRLTSHGSRFTASGAAPRKFSPRSAARRKSARRRHPARRWQSPPAASRWRARRCLWLRKVRGRFYPAPAQF